MKWPRGREVLRSFAGIAPARARREASLRAELLARVLVAAAAAEALFVALGWMTALDRATYATLAIEGAVAIPVAFLFLRRGRVPHATALLLAVSSHPAAFAMKAYGVASPAGSLFLVTIVLCGLLVGGWFLSAWTAICCAVVAWVAAASAGPGGPFPLDSVLFWIAAFVVTSALVGAMARRLEGAHAVSRGQAAALARLLGLALDRARTEDALPAALAAVAAETGAGRAAVERPGAAVASASANSGAEVRVPLEGAGRPLGTLVLARETHDPFSAEEAALARALAQPVAAALLLADLAAAERDAAVLEERNRIGREIHDSLAQGFTGIVLQLHAAEAALPDDLAAAREHLSRARELGRESLDAARRSVWALRPPSLGREGLAAAVERLAREITAGTGIAVRAEMEGAIAALPAEVDAELRGIAREAITNAVRHAAPSEIRTSVRFAADSVTLEIGDNGRGEGEGAEPRSEPGFGATSLRERVSKIGGKLAVDSRPGAGTRVRVDVPRNAT